MRQEKRRHYEELNESAGHDTTDLRAQYMGPYPPYQRKRRLYEFASAVRHNNITFEPITTMAEVFAKKKKKIS